MQYCTVTKRQPGDRGMILLSQECRGLNMWCMSMESPSYIQTKVTRSQKDPYHQPLEAIKLSRPIFINSPLHYHKIKDVTAEL